jgi:dihydroxy-acid dehydratase
MADHDARFWKRNRVEMRAAGFDPDLTAGLDLVVTVASPFTNAHRCNNRVRRITDLTVEALSQLNAQGLIVGTPAVSDALTQGTPSSGFSLVSRDLIADCIELGHEAHHANAMIVISGCDKVGAAALMPLARLNEVGLVI